MVTPFDASSGVSWTSTRPSVWQQHCSTRAPRAWWCAARPVSRRRSAITRSWRCSKRPSRWRTRAARRSSRARRPTTPPRASSSSREAAQLGVDGILGTVPYYNNPPQEGLFQHFRAIARAVDLPVILYNIPCPLAAQHGASTTLRLAREVPNIVGVKEASANFKQIGEIIRDAPDGFQRLERQRRRHPDDHGARRLRRRIGRGAPGRAADRRADARVRRRRRRAGR